MTGRAKVRPLPALPLMEPLDLDRVEDAAINLVYCPHCGTIAGIRCRKGYGRYAPIHVERMRHALGMMHRALRLFEALERERAS